MSERDELIECLRVCGACHGCGIGADGDTCTNCGDERQLNRLAASLLERDGAELERLRAEVERLTRERDDPGTTHADGCASWGPKHYACALARLEAWDMPADDDGDMIPPTDAAMEGGK